MTTDEIVKRLAKPLGPWTQSASNAWECGHYHINQHWPHNDGPFYVSVSRGAEVGVARLGQFPTLAAAQAAAEADYRARIAAALDLEPVAKLVEALELYSCDDGCNDCPAHERDRVGCGWTARVALAAAKAQVGALTPLLERAVVRVPPAFHALRAEIRAALAEVQADARRDGEGGE